MCGLFGWNLQKRVKKRRHRQLVRLSAALMVQNASRGDDSWGVYSPNTDKRIVGLGCITSMTRKTRDFMLGSDILIAHTRRATTGTISQQNCHPFRVGSLVGAHNGIVSNHERLNSEYGRTCTVDSEHLFYHLAEGRELHDITAYGAITFHDKTSEWPIQLAVFNDGDLAIAQVKDIGTFWSSDKTHLKRALEIAGWKDCGIEAPVEGLVYSADSDKLDVQSEIVVDKPIWASDEYRGWHNYCYSGYNPKTEDTVKVTASDGEVLELTALDISSLDVKEDTSTALTAYPDEEGWPYAHRG